MPIATLAAQKEPDFLAHLIAWDRTHGQILDAKAALPIVTLAVPEYPEELIENSLAHLTLLNPRELLKAYLFAREIKISGRHRRVRKLIAAYLRDKEKHNWDRVAVQHREVLKRLYALTHTNRNQRVGSVLFGGEGSKRKNRERIKVPLPKGSIFESVTMLKDMSPREAAGTILEKKIPFLIAVGALGSKAKDPDLVLALIERMSPTEVVTNTKMLERLGVKDHPALRAAFEQALVRAAESKKTTFKATRAAEAMTDEKLKAKLIAVQEKQIQTLGTVEGNWLVLGDKSGSMSSTIEVARVVAGTLAKMVSGKVMLSFFDTTPMNLDVTGKTYEEILAATKRISAQGGTSIGCGMAAALARKDEIDGIAIISDAAENTPPFFWDAYQKYSRWADKDIPVYLYRCELGQQGWGDIDLENSMKEKGLGMQVFNLTQGVDYYSLPNLVQSMRTNQYSLADEILATPLLTLREAFTNESQDAI